MRVHSQVVAGTLCILWGCSIARADITVTQTTTITQRPAPLASGKAPPAKSITRTERISIHENALRIEDLSTGRILIVDLDAMKALEIDSKARTVAEIPFALAGALADREKQLKAELKRVLEQLLRERETYTRQLTQTIEQRAYTTLTEAERRRISKNMDKLISGALTGSRREANITDKRRLFMLRNQATKMKKLQLAAVDEEVRKTIPDSPSKVTAARRDAEKYLEFRVQQMLEEIKPFFDVLVAASAETTRTSWDPEVKPIVDPNLGAEEGAAPLQLASRTNGRTSRSRTRSRGDDDEDEGYDDEEMEEEMEDEEEEDYDEEEMEEMEEMDEEEDEEEMERFTRTARQPGRGGPAVPGVGALPPDMPAIPEYPVTPDPVATVGEHLGYKTNRYVVYEAGEKAVDVALSVEAAREPLQFFRYLHPELGVLSHSVLRRCQSLEGYPIQAQLRLALSDGKQVSVSWSATSITVGKLSRSEFRAPLGYTKKTAEAVTFWNID